MSVRLDDHKIIIIKNTLEKIKFKKKKLKREPSLKKPGDFTMAEGHGHPLVDIISTSGLRPKYFFSGLPLNSSRHQAGQTFHPSP